MPLENRPEQTPCSIEWSNLTRELMPKQPLCKPEVAGSIPARREAADAQLRGAAALSAGHLARRFGTLAPETQAMVRAVAHDLSVDGRKYDALDDIEQFLRRDS
jgi:hypothetical protein